MGGLTPGGGIPGNGGRPGGIIPGGTGAILSSKINK
jgi:hypothetical protein